MAEVRGRVISRSAFFDAGTTSPIDCTHLMTKLTKDCSAWQEWKGQIPFIFKGGLVELHSESQWRHGIFSSFVFSMY